MKHSTVPGVDAAINIVLGALLPIAVIVVMETAHAVRAGEVVTEFKVKPIGHVKKSEDRTLIVLDKKYTPGLLGLDGFSHIFVFWWFDRNDTPEKRAILQVHPRGDRDNPLRGVFATRSPVRPNLIALTLCKFTSVKENVIEIEKTDAFDGTPVLDIKPFIPGYDSTPNAKLPDWLVKARKQHQENQ
jgi:tRNA-Thr(GGU) m(6)t(6)A37 methyltransferase TsaA